MLQFLSFDDIMVFYYINDDEDIVDGRKLISTKMEFLFSMFY